MPARDFKCLSESELDRLSDERLVEYVAATRQAGEAQCAKRGAGVLAWRFWPRVQVKCRLSVPSGDVDDVAMSVMESAVKSAFDGKVIGQFGSFINVITRRRIADFHEDRKRRPKTDPLAEEHNDEEGYWGSDGVTEPDTVEIEWKDAAERVLARLKPTHRAVVRLYGSGLLGFEELSAAGAKARLEQDNPGEVISEANIHQIWSRFRKELHKELYGEEGMPDG